MAGNEIQFDFQSGNTVYQLTRNDAGQVNIVAGNTFENYNAGNIATYVKTVPDKSGDKYVGDFNTNITSAGRYTVQIFLQAGANPADGDRCIGGGVIVWNGSSEDGSEKLIQAAKLLINKVIQNKTTGVITVYDNDGETAILTLTPSDDGSQITLTPSTP